MFRPKIMIILIGGVAALLVSVAPASAWWEGATESKGPVTVANSGEFVSGGVPLKCVASEIKATWNIQTKGQIKIHLKEEKQLKTKFGPHLNITVANWGKCTEVIGGVTVEVAISACELQLVQDKGSFVATLGIVTPCVMKAPAAECTIVLPAGMEKAPQSNTGWNIGLKETKLENSGANQKDVVGIKEQILAIQIGAGAICPTTNSKASLTGFEFTAEGVKAA
jgi:hypothetical protein